MKRLLKNKQGTAEVIGSVMFIVILLFFFTNVYLWHDAATKEMNDLYAQKINSPITVSYDPRSETLFVTNVGGVDAVISGVWVNVKSSSGSPDSDHRFFDLVNQKIVIHPGDELPILNYDIEGKTGSLKVVTTIGNIASGYFQP